MANKTSWVLLTAGSVVQAVKTSGQLGTIQQNINLAQFVVEGTLTGRELGSGYFGTVEEVYIACV